MALIHPTLVPATIAELCSDLLAHRDPFDDLPNEIIEHIGFFAATL